MNTQQIALLLATHHMRSNAGNHTCAAPGCTWTVHTYHRLADPQNANTAQGAIRAAFAKHQAETITDAVRDAELTHMQAHA